MPLVQPSIPIIYFGNLPSYLASPCKIITVGLNPSLAEFPSDDPFLRFPDASILYPAILHDATLYLDYLASLNAYFEKAPYCPWFCSSFEHLLKGMHTSYFAGTANRALHTDICSPLATNPTDAGLSPAQKIYLESAGVPLWKQLVACLDPDIILISVRKSLHDQLTWPVTKALAPLADWPGVAYKAIDTCCVTLSSGKNTLVIFGRAAQTPFGYLKHSEKEQAGGIVAASWLAY